ncbi:MAG TPA: dTMP kinase [Frankiaceae bacterium]|nr:dTMP kinase [Frankiaceae bacterium]
MPVSDVRAVLRIPAFRRLWIALSFSSLGDWLGLLATTALAQELNTGYSAKAYAIGAVLGVRLVPSLLFGPLAGALADRLNRRVTMVVCDIIRCALFVSIPFVHGVWWLLVASFLIECASLLWIPAKEASVPNLVPKDRLEAANQLSLFSTYGSAAPAAGLFALLSTLSTPLGDAVPFFTHRTTALALFVNAASFLVSAATVSSLHTIGRARPAVSPDGTAVGVLQSIGDGFSFVRRDPLVRGLVVGILGGFAGAGTTISLGRLYVELLDGGDAAYGVLFGAVFLGLAAGIAGGPRLLGGYSRRRLFGIAVTLGGVSLALVAVSPNLVLSLLIVIFVGAFSGVAWVTGLTLLGREVSDELRGRTFALVQSIVRLELLFVLAAAPFLVGLIGKHAFHFSRVTIRADGVTVVLLAGGLIAVAVGLISYRQMDDRPGVAVLPEIWKAVRGGYLRPAVPPYEGRFLALEGGEGAGKSTQAERLAAHLRELGHEVIVTREPGDTAVGQHLRRLLLDPTVEVTDETEALLYAADRAEHVARVVRPALERGAIVITDRYVDSSIAYQGYGRGLNPETISRISRWATSELLPDLTVLLDLPVDEGMARARARGRASGMETDRMEAETREFHERIRKGFLRLVAEDSPRYALVNAAQSPDDVAAAVRRAVEPTLPPAATTGTTEPSTPQPIPDPSAAPDSVNV